MVETGMTSVLTTQNAKLCLFCKRTITDEVDFGGLKSLEEINVHYYCLLFSATVKQSGEDNEGILGFIKRDIVAEHSAAANKRCYYCSNSGANLRCARKKCNRNFHLPCGLLRNIQLDYNHFTPFCHIHRKRSNVPAYIRKSLSDYQCLICLENFEKDVIITKVIWADCCKCNVLLHAGCMQQMALSAGYFTKCPGCNNEKKFIQTIQTHGVFVPQRDASWELADNAYAELYYTHNRCDVFKCLCPYGPEYKTRDGKWKIRVCSLCGSFGTHNYCTKSKTQVKCGLCSVTVASTISESTEEERTTNTESTNSGRSDTAWEDDLISLINSPSRSTSIQKTMDELLSALSAIGSTSRNDLMTTTNSPIKTKKSTNLIDDLMIATNSFSASRITSMIDTTIPNNSLIMTEATNSASGTTSMIDITIPNNSLTMTEATNSASGSTSMIDITIPNNSLTMTEATNSAIGSTSMIDITIPNNSLTMTEATNFTSGTTSVIDITIPNNSLTMTEATNSASGSTSMSDITIPNNSLTMMEATSFASGSTSMIDITIPHNCLTTTEATNFASGTTSVIDIPIPNNSLTMTEATNSGSGSTSMIDITIPHNCLTTTEATNFASGTTSVIDIPIPNNSLTMTEATNSASGSTSMIDITIPNNSLTTTEATNFASGTTSVIDIPIPNNSLTMTEATNSATGSTSMIDITIPNNSLTITETTNSASESTLMCDLTECTNKANGQTNSSGSSTSQMDINISSNAPPVIKRIEETEKVNLSDLASINVASEEKRSTNRIELSSTPNKRKKLILIRRDFELRPDGSIAIIPRNTTSQSSHKNNVKKRLKKRRNFTLSQGGNALAKQSSADIQVLHANKTAEIEKSKHFEMGSRSTLMSDLMVCNNSVTSRSINVAPKEKPSTNQIELPIELPINPNRKKLKFKLKRRDFVICPNGSIAIIPKSTSQILHKNRIIKKRLKRLNFTLSQDGNAVAKQSTTDNIQLPHVNKNTNKVKLIRRHFEMSPDGNVIERPSNNAKHCTLTSSSWSKTSKSNNYGEQMGSCAAMKDSFKCPISTRTLIGQFETIPKDKNYLKQSRSYESNTANTTTTTSKYKPSFPNAKYCTLTSNSSSKTSKSNNYGEQMGSCAAMKDSFKCPISTRTLIGQFETIPKDKNYLKQSRSYESNTANTTTTTSKYKPSFPNAKYCTLTSNSSSKTSKSNNYGEQMGSCAAMNDSFKCPISTRTWIGQFETIPKDKNYPKESHNYESNTTNTTTTTSKYKPLFPIWTHSNSEIEFVTKAQSPKNTNTGATEISDNDQGSNTAVNYNIFPSAESTVFKLSNKSGRSRLKTDDFATRPQSDHKASSDSNM